MYQQMLIQLALNLSEKVMSDPDLQEELKHQTGNLLDFLQVTTGNVNLRSQQEAIELALKTCIRKDPKSQLQVTAYVTALYLQYGQQNLVGGGWSGPAVTLVKLPGMLQQKGLRGAQVGGSLLKHFGRTYFPHIADRELKYALDVDPQLLKHIHSELTRKASSKS